MCVSVLTFMATKFKASCFQQLLYRTQYKKEYEVWLIGTRPRRVSNHSKALLSSWYDGTPRVI